MCIRDSSDRWPFEGVPTASQMVADHVVAQESFLPNAELILENRSPAQNPVNLALCTDSENASKGSLPISAFSTADAQSAMGLYTPVGVSDAKKAMLARKIAYTLLAYVGVSNKRTSKGTAALSRSCGIEAYNLAWQEGSFERHLTGPVSAWERRMALLTLAVEKWQLANPLVLHGTTPTAPLKAQLVKRFRGEDALLKLCDAALVDLSLIHI